MRRRRRRTYEGGQTIALFALATALFLFGMVALVIDLSYEFSWSTRVAGAAQIAAQSGANSVNPAFLYGGGPGGGGDPGCAGNTQILDVCRDVATCEESGNNSAGITASDGPASGTTCRSASGGTTVHAEVVKVISLPIAFFGTTAVVRGSFDAAPVRGACAVAVAGTPPPCPR
ncbi:MAG: hypothetical protein ABR564_10170 [Candidatus Dormibacteria bacterium]